MLEVLKFVWELICPLENLHKLIDPFYLPLHQEKPNIPPNITKTVKISEDP